MLIWLTATQYWNFWTLLSNLYHCASSVWVEWLMKYWLWVITNVTLSKYSTFEYFHEHWIYLIKGNHSGYLLKLSITVSYNQICLFKNCLPIKNLSTLQFRKEHRLWDDLPINIWPKHKTAKNGDMKSIEIG